MDEPVVIEVACSVSSGEALFEARGKFDELIEALRAFLEREEPFDRTMVLNFSDGLEASSRQQARDAVLTALIGSSWVDSWSDELAEGSGSDSLVTVDAALTPAFAIFDDSWGNRWIGSWSNDRTLRCDHFEGTEHDGDPLEEWFGVSHSAPDSMASGWWMDSLYALAPGVLLTHSHMDENGESFGLEPAPEDASEIAERIERFVLNLSLQGAERYVLALYAYGLLSTGAVPDVRVEMIPDCDSDDYEFAFRLNPPPPAIGAIIERGRLDDEERWRLADTIIAHAEARAEDGEEIDDVWMVVLEHLRSGRTWTP